MLCRLRSRALENVSIFATRKDQFSPVRTITDHGKLAGFSAIFGACASSYAGLTRGFSLRSALTRKIYFYVFVYIKGG